MNRICNCLDKENEEVSSNTMDPKLKFKWILTVVREDLPASKNHDSKNSDNNRKRCESCPIVDEVAKKVNHVTKKEKNHIG